MKSRRAIFLALWLASVSAPALSEEAAGDWGGLLAGELRVIVHVTKNADGHYAGFLESVDQGKEVLRASDIAVAPERLNFSIPDIGGRFTGAWVVAKNAWVGTWTQGQTVPLVLTRLSVAGKDTILPKRPQEALIEKRKPDQAIQVSFANPTDGVRLAGTLSIPDGNGPFSAAVLVGGSGRLDRDEYAYGHKSFLVLADALSRQGIAVLRYDKRSVGASGGDFEAATSAEFAMDADAALRFLGSRPEIDHRHIGLIGHSEGAAIAAAVGTRDPAVAFVVMMAGPGLRGDRLTVLQGARLATAGGASDATVARLVAFNEKLYADLMAVSADSDAINVAKADIIKGVAEQIIPAGSAEAMLTQVASPWFRRVLSYDPVPTLRQLSAPVLVLTGSLDLQIPATENLPLIREALKGNGNATIIEMPGLNHMFQTAKTGAPTEYGDIDETIAPAALGLITDWVTRVGHSGRDASGIRE